MLGPNGAGKTTLLRMLFGLVTPDAGSIELFGRPLHGSDHSSLDGVAGFVEDPSFYPYLSGRANLELLAELDGAGARRRIDDVLERVDLLDRARDRVERLLLRDAPAARDRRGATARATSAAARRADERA